MEIDPKQFEKLDTLGLTNTVTLSALVALLVRKGVLTEGELTMEIRQLRAKLSQTGES